MERIAALMMALMVGLITCGQRQNNPEVFTVQLLCDSPEIYRIDYTAYLDGEYLCTGGSGVPPQARRVVGQRTRPTGIERSAATRRVSRRSFQSSRELTFSREVGDVTGFQRELAPFGPVQGETLAAGGDLAVRRALCACRPLDTQEKYRHFRRK